MKYNLVDLRLMTVKNGNNQGSKYLQATLENPDDPFVNSGDVIFFNERMVQVFSEYLSDAQPSGKKDAFGRDIYVSTLKNASNPIPPKYLVLPHAFQVQWATPEPMVLIDTATGLPRTTKAGNLIVKTSITVLTRKQVDNETGELSYIRGFDPDTLGTQLMNAFYKPLKMFQNDIPAAPVAPVEPVTHENSFTPQGAQVPPQGAF